MERARSADRTRIAWEQHGLGAPVVLVAGALCDRTSLEPLARALAAAGHAAVTYDRRGRGDSDAGAAGGWDLPAAEAADVLAVAAACDARALYGHSSGAVLAMHAAAAGNRTFERVVLHEPPVAPLAPGAREEQAAFADEIAALVAGEGPEAAITRFLGSFGTPAEAMAPVLADPRTVANGRMLEADMRVSAARPVAELAAATAVPTLVLVGTASGPFFAQGAQQVLAALPKGSLEHLDGAGHDAGGEVVAAPVLRFLRAGGRRRLAGAVDLRFTAVLDREDKPGAWTCLFWPEAAQALGTRGRVAVRGTMDGHPFASSFMAQGDGRHRLPVKAELLTALGKAPGDPVEVHVTERLS